MQPTDQDIFNLKNGNLSPVEFDENMEQANIKFMLQIK